MCDVFSLNTQRKSEESFFIGSYNYTTYLFNDEDLELILNFIVYRMLFTEHTNFLVGLYGSPEKKSYNCIQHLYTRSKYL